MDDVDDNMMDEISVWKRTSFDDEWRTSLTVGAYESHVEGQCAQDITLVPRYASVMPALFLAPYEFSADCSENVSQNLTFTRRLMDPWNDRGKSRSRST